MCSVCLANFEGQTRPLCMDGNWADQNKRSQGFREYCRVVLLMHPVNAAQEMPSVNRKLYLVVRDYLVLYYHKKICYMNALNRACACAFGRASPDCDILAFGVAMPISLLVGSILVLCQSPLGMLLLGEAHRFAGLSTVSSINSILCCTALSAY